MRCEYMMVEKLLRCGYRLVFLLEFDANHQTDSANGHNQFRIIRHDFLEFRLEISASIGSPFGYILGYKHLDCRYASRA